MIKVKYREEATRILSDAAPLCRHCNLSLRHGTIGACGGAILRRIDQRLDSLLENWMKTPLHKISDPTARNSVELSPDEWNRVVHVYLKSKELPGKIGADLCSGVANGVFRINRGRSQTAVLIKALSAGGAPCTIEQIQTRLAEFIEKMIRCEESAKVRLRIDHDETK